LLTIYLHRRAAQLEKLENKIEHLVNALSTSQAFNGNGSQTSPSESDHSNARRPSEVVDSLCDPQFSETNLPRATPAAAPSLTTAAAPGSSDPTLPPAGNVHPGDLDPFGVAMDHAEILLDRFRRLMAPTMPFVVITPETTATSLHAQKPFLLHAIVTVTYFHDLPVQQRMVKQLMRDLSERLLMNSEKSIGLLQGLLVRAMPVFKHTMMTLADCCKGLRCLVSSAHLLGPAGHEPSPSCHRANDRVGHRSDTGEQGSGF